MTDLPRRIALLCCLSMLLACSSGEGSNASANAMANNTSANNSTLSCPTMPGDATGSCPLDGLVCEYGEDARRDCRYRASCNNGSWQLSVPDCDPLETQDCPTSIEVSGMTCSEQDKTCAVEGFVCNCSNCDDSGPAVQCMGDPTWRCAGMAAEEGCPEPAPLLGKACADPGQDCTYGDPVCGSGLAITCDRGVWLGRPVENGDTCPISSRKAKENIHYLQQAELEALHEQTMKVRLSTYRYRDPRLGAGPKLGFIIEDMPTNSPAVRPNRQHVDLYGYTSMLLGTIQTQQAQIEALERRLEALERQQVKTSTE